MLRRSLWHLRYRKSTLGLLGDDGDNDGCESIPQPQVPTTFQLDKSSAAEIFRVTPGTDDPWKRTIVSEDGQETEYELIKAFNQKPTKAFDKKFLVKNLNAVESPLFIRMRVWILGYTVGAIIFGYLLSFILINLVFAILWYLPPEKCCGDPSMAFAEVLNFAIQVSTTLGYGGNEPEGLYSNILVNLNFFVSLTLHALFAGVIFLKFVTPSAKIDFSKIMTLSNVNGLPCLEIRVGNADGGNMVLQDLTARLHFMYIIRYTDELGKSHEMRSMQEVHFLVDWRYELREVWTLRHVLDETSPLFGVLGVPELQQDIDWFRVTIDAIQDVTKMHVAESAVYRVEDVLVGYRFQDHISWDEANQQLLIDYGKMNDVVPHPVWYPVQSTQQANKEEEPREAAAHSNISRIDHSTRTERPADHQLRDQLEEVRRNQWDMRQSQSQIEQYQCQMQQAQAETLQEQRKLQAQIQALLAEQKQQQQPWWERPIPSVPVAASSVGRPSTVPVPERGAVSLSAPAAALTIVRSCTGNGTSDNSNNADYTMPFRSDTMGPVEGV